MKTEIYRNLHKKCFSVRQKGRVVGHLQDNHILRLKNVKFAVQPAGHKRVLREKKKNVHAFVRGNVVDGYPTWDQVPFDKEVTYNPYKGNTFYYKYSGFPIEHADEVLIQDGKVWVR